MPTLARSACISSAIFLPSRLYGRYTGMVQRSIARSFTPAPPAASWPCRIVADTPGPRRCRTRWSAASGSSPATAPPRIHRLQDRVLVDRHVDRLAHELVVERLHLVVEMPDSRCSGLPAPSSVSFGSALIAGRSARFGNGMIWHSSARSLAIADRRILGDREDQVVDLRLAAPIVRVGLVADHRVLLVLDEDRTDRCRPAPGRSAPACRAFCERVGIFLGQDRGQVHREIGQERRLRRGQRELHRVVVDLLDALQVVACPCRRSSRRCRRTPVIRVVLSTAGRS